MSIKNFFLSLLLIAGVLQIGTAQTVLSAGDIAIVGIKTDNPDNFSFVLLVDIEAGTEIRFTDSGWKDTNTFRGNEGAKKYTAPTALAKGTLISLVGNAADFANDNDTGVGTNGLILSGSGDQVFAFQGLSTAPSFVFAAQTNSTQWQSNATGSTNSAIPQGLTDGINAVAVGKSAGTGDEWDNAWYTGITTGTQAELLAAIADQSNWTGNNSSYSPYTADFTVTGGAEPTPSSVTAGTVIAGGNIESTADTPAEAVGVLEFNITDFGGDGASTIVTSIRIDAAASNNGSWTALIAGAKLQRDGVNVPVTGLTIDAGYMRFDIGANGLNITEESMAVIRLFVYLKTSVTEGNKLSFRLSYDNATPITVDAASTAIENPFSGGDVVSQDFTVVITATELRFGQQPSDVNLNDIMYPHVTVHFTDENGNTDINKTAKINMTVTGSTIAGTTEVAGFGGTATFSSIAFTTAATDVTITAHDKDNVMGTNEQVTSTTFDVLSTAPVTPTAVCQNITIQLDATGAASITGDDIDGGSTAGGEETITSLTPSMTTFSCDHSGGVVPVSLTVMNSAGESDECDADVTVQDLIAPEIDCPTDVMADADEGMCEGYAPLGIPSFSDNCEVEEMENNGFDSYPVGTTPVTWTVSDFYGNTAACVQNVTIIDAEAPMLSCPTDMTVNSETGVCSATVVLSTAIADDNCGVEDLQNDHADTTYPVGTTPVTWTATDMHGNTAECTQNVSVMDIETPMISCGENVTVSTDTGTCGAVVNLTAPAVSDNCSTSVVNDLSGGTFPIGTTTTTWVATDTGGNTVSCQQDVTVVDDIAPTANCRNINLRLAEGTASLVAGDIDNGSSDGCGLLPLVASQTTFTTANLGENSVTLTVTDYYGNTASCESTVTILEESTSTLTFDGSTYVDFGAQADFDFGTDDFTYEFLLTTTVRNFQGVLVKRNVGMNTQYMTCNILSGRMVATLNNQRIITRIDVADGVQRHFALVRSGNEFYLYINGVKAGYWTSAPVSGSIDNGASLVAGKFFSNLPHSYFTGSINELRVWSGALPASELNQIITGGETSLMGYYQFDQATGNNLPDGSGHGNNGTIR